MEELNVVKVVEKMCKKYCKRRKFILLLIKICTDHNIKNIENYIEEYLLGVSKGV